MDPDLPNLFSCPWLARVPILHQELHEAFDLEHLGENERSILLDQPPEKPCDHAARNLEAGSGMTAEQFRPPDPGTYCTEFS